jgi:hypothetical protein
MSRRYGCSPLIPSAWIGTQSERKAGFVGRDRWRHQTPKRPRAGRRGGRTSRVLTRVRSGHTKGHPHAPAVAMHVDHRGGRCQLPPPGLSYDAISGLTACVRRPSPEWHRAAWTYGTRAQVTLAAATARRLAGRSRELLKVSSRRGELRPTTTNAPRVCGTDRARLAAVIAHLATLGVRRVVARCGQSLR